METRKIVEKSVVIELRAERAREPERGSRVESRYGRYGVILLREFFVRLCVTHGRGGPGGFTTSIGREFALGSINAPKNTYKLVFFF